jgi:hypothetical protein
MKTLIKARTLLSAMVVLFSLGSSVCCAAGAGVIRFTDQVAFFIVDDAGGLVSFHGTNISFADICSGVPFEFDPLSIQLIATASGALHALFKGKEHNVIIYPAANWPNPDQIGPGDCPILATLPVLASGPVRLVRTDNDIEVSGRGADAFGWTSSGVLTSPTGQRFSYSETVRALVEPAQKPGDPEFRTLVIDIRLVPIH